MNDERLLGKVGSWLKDTDNAQPDAERITARAMAQVPQVRQRSRWWPLPILDRGGQPAPASRSTAFSALKFVTAGLIVGLLGGFLLAGALTTQPVDQAPAAATDAPSPMTTEQLLSVAETVEVEPGVLQVIDDGIRGLASGDNISLVSGRDGGIWLLSKHGFLRVATEGTYEWPTGRAESVSDFEVAPDGTVWTVQVDGDGLAVVRSFDGQQWTSHEPTSDTRTAAIARDGTVWAMWQEPGSEMVTLGYLAGGDRRPVGEWPASELYGGDLYLTGADEAWLFGAPEYRVGKPRPYRLVDGALRQEYEDTVVAADVGPDGTVWFVSLDELIRVDGSTGEADPEPWALPEAMTAEWGSASGWTFLPGDALRVTPDGGVWFALRAASGPPLSEEHCGGIAHFDGTTWLGPYLADRCVESIELAADGSAWLLAHAAESSDDPVDLFVVTPEAAS
jgi:hypothetical protein